ncbi:thioesterase family protein [Taibaiella sp. KBW10]|uniref:thioesterase family protein n=1 Tax=Taibaiella sp. KBW10 TaxID=2153357 RepID=UPI0013154975|nr:thioesterase family protein [Taibaiella sp. KBW10]
MSRVKIIIPERIPDYKTTLSIRVTDINYGNHLANDKLVALLHESRVLMLSAWGYTEFDVEGVSLIQADLMVSYQNEGFLGDQLSFALYLTNFTSRSFDLLYHISTIRAGQVLTIAMAKVGLVCFDYVHKKTISIPAAFTQKFSP